ncbi:MAG: hypothetical protein AAB116_19735 [Candidatus Poribacteria bacterium]
MDGEIGARFWILDAMLGFVPQPNLQNYLKKPNKTQRHEGAKSQRGVEG